MNVPPITVMERPSQPTGNAPIESRSGFDQALVLIGLNSARQLGLAAQKGDARWVSERQASDPKSATVRNTKGNQRGEVALSGAQADPNLDASAGEVAGSASGSRQDDARQSTGTGEGQTSASSAESSGASGSGQRAVSADSQTTTTATAVTTLGEQVVTITPDSQGAPSASQHVTIPLPDTGSPQDQANMARAIRGLQTALNQNGGSVTLRLSPPELGVIRIQLQVTEGVVRAQIWTENQSVQTLLRQQVGHLHNALESHGLKVDRLDVQSMQPSASSLDYDQSDEDNLPDDGRSRGQYAASDQRQERHDDDDDPSQPTTFDQELNALA